MSLLGLFLALSRIASAGSYGVIEAGQPSWSQRDVHTATNFVRVDPTAWEGDYPCATSDWSSGERSAKEPLYYHDGLATIAQQHTEEMERYGELTHDSHDGTSFGDRVFPWYNGTTIAENVAWGYPDPWSVVVEGWMCSSGHRSNIMSGDLEDMGTGVSGTWWTQDFGGGARTDHHAIAMGVHEPERPGRTVTFLATYSGTGAVGSMRVDSDEGCIDMERVAGTPDRGAWEVSTDAGDGCRRYRFVWEDEDGESGALPDDGSYQYGSGCEEWVEDVADACGLPGGSGDDDPPDDGGGGDSSDEGGNEADTGAPAGDCEDAGFVDRNDDCEPDPSMAGAKEAGTTGCGCGTAGTTGAGWLAMAVGSLLVRRRR